MQKHHLQNRNLLCTTHHHPSPPHILFKLHTCWNHGLRRGLLFLSLQAYTRLNSDNNFGLFWSFVLGIKPPLQHENKLFNGFKLYEQTLIHENSVTLLTLLCVCGVYLIQKLSQYLGDQFL